MDINEIFNAKFTENGDVAFKKVSDDDLLNILFLTEYYTNHLTEVPNIGTSDRAKLFAQFIRDPRLGLGKRDLGRTLMNMSKCSFEEYLNAGRADDILFNFNEKSIEEKKNILDFLYVEIQYKNNALVKKWMPRYSSKNLLLAREIAKMWKINKQTYGHFVKCDTTEYKLSLHKEDDIKFEQVPSLATIKYARAFATKTATKERYAKYLEDVRKGKKKLNVSTTNVYDIFKNRNRIDPDLFFSKIEKIKGNWIPIVDTSGSMQDTNDSYGKALAIGHYLAKCSTYAPDKVISFSSHPQLITLGNFINSRRALIYEGESQYMREIYSMHTGDCSNTDFGAVMNLLSYLDELPEYLVVLSDMEFDRGSRTSKEDTMKLFKSKGYTTKIIWWNLNSRSITCPEMDKDGNIFISGYNPILLKFLQANFDGHKFLDVLLDEYSKAIKK